MHRLPFCCQSHTQDSKQSFANRVHNTTINLSGQLKNNLKSVLNIYSPPEKESLNEPPQGAQRYSQAGLSRAGIPESQGATTEKASCSHQPGFCQRWDLSKRSEKDSHFQVLYKPHFSVDSPHSQLIPLLAAMNYYVKCGSQALGNENRFSTFLYKLAKLLAIYL